MNIIKNKHRNKIKMGLYGSSHALERNLLIIENEVVIKDFEALGFRRIRFSQFLFKCFLYCLVSYVAFLVCKCL